jgi:hypothetical protein
LPLQEILQLSVDLSGSPASLQRDDLACSGCTPTAMRPCSFIPRSGHRLSTPAARGG